MVIYQHVDEFRKADGIGGDVAQFYEIIKKLGFDTKIVCRLTTFEKENNILNIGESIDYKEDDIHIFHYGGSGYPFDYFYSLPGKKILRYHNVTPSEYFKKIDKDLYKSMKLFEIRSMIELDKLKNVINVVLTDSKYNSSALKEMGYNNIVYFPVLRKYNVNNNKRKIEKKIGFIGRIVPNKKIEDLIILQYFLKKIDPEYKLVIIGTIRKAFLPYNTKIQNLISELGIANSVLFLENLDDINKEKELETWAAYVSMSEHEGFGIPLLESFAAGVPVLAFKSSGISETLKGGGILFKGKNYIKIAALINKIYEDEKLKNKIRKRQYKAVSFYNNFSFENILNRVIYKCQYEK